MYELSLSSSIIYGNHSTARQPPCRMQPTKHVPIRARQRKQADRVGESQHAYRAFIMQLAAFSRRTKHLILPGLQQIPQPLTTQLSCGVMREEFAFVSNLNKDTTMLFSLRSFHRTGTYVFRTCMRRPGSFRLGHGALGICKSSVRTKVVDLSVRFTSSHFVLFFRVRERSGRRKPPEPSALYTAVLLNTPLKSWKIRAYQVPSRRSRREERLGSGIDT